MNESEPGVDHELLAGSIASHEDLASRISEMHGMDTVDACRIRLVALRTRIETNWPQGSSGILRRGSGLNRDVAADIADLLTALPTPLPNRPGGDPEPVMADTDTDTDLRAVAGRAVDAALALLDGSAMDTPYLGSVTMLAKNGPGAASPIVIANPTVGLLVATIIGTLDAISESILEPDRSPGRTNETAARAPRPGFDTDSEGSSTEPRGHGPNVPHI
jgi:hypothetical protein